MRSLPIIGLGLFFVIGGIALFAFTLRKAPAPTAPVKKSELRDQEAHQAELKKLRILSAGSVVAGIVLMVLS